MDLLEQAIECGPLRHVHDEQVRAFDNAVKDMLKDLARRADHDDGEES